MPYPTIGEYKDAIRLAEHSFGNLTHLRPEYDATGDLHFSSGNFAVVFKMRDTRTDRPVAVKCFLREQPLRNQRYAQISQCLDSLPHTPYLLRYTYHPAEIWVETALSEQREFEVVTLDWVEGQTLSNYLQQCCKAGDTAALRKVAEAFDRLALWLLEQPFAHGDLKPDNILVTPRGGLVLVDYDGMFTPDMAGKEATELGSPAFRHPYRSSAHFGKYIDHVPILVLSLSLYVLAEHPDWLETYYQGDNLILTANDLSKPDSPIFHTIRTQCSAWTTQNRLLGLVNALILPISAAIPVSYLRSIPDYTDIQLIPYVKYFKDGRKRWGICDEHKNLIVDFQYYAVKPFKTGMIRVNKGNKWGVIDETSREIVPCIYEEIHDFSEGLAVRNRYETYGFIDREGQEVIPCIYRAASPFQEGLAVVANQEWKRGFINKKGQEVIPYIYRKASPFREGLAAVKNKCQEWWGFINKEGKEIVPCIYNYVLPFHEGLAAVANKEWKRGFINKEGQEIIPCIYYKLSSFQEGLAAAVKNKYESWGFIDREGQEVIPHIYDEVLSFQEGLAAVKNKDYKWSFIDKEGKEVIPCIYDEVSSFQEGVARVKKDRYWGFIDNEGNEITAFVYSSASDFGQGIALVKIGEKAFYIDKKGVEYWVEEE